jgi:hypothetical protein
MCAHQSRADPARLSAKRARLAAATGAAEILVRGPIGPTMMQAVPAFDRGPKRPRRAPSGALPDQSALYGVINQLEALGLQLLEIRRPKPCGGGGPAKSHDLCDDDSLRPA